ncbi:MAG: HNH endonuclease [Chitinophagaceae bacterium]|nr:MAG: HNH endonuclease [Chitinophagaceae bacterium]
MSELGNVRVEVDRHNIKAGKHLRQTPDRDGYLSVTLSADGKRQKSHRVALLVLAGFTGPCPRGYESNHKNGRRNDNRHENLEYSTKAENVKHSIQALGRDYRGAKNPSARLSEDQVVSLRHRAASGESFTALGEAFDVSKTMARLIATGRAWTNTGGPRVEPPGKGRR